MNFGVVVVVIVVYIFFGCYFEMAKAEEEENIPKKITLHFAVANCTTGINVRDKLLPPDKTSSDIGILKNIRCLLRTNIGAREKKRIMFHDFAVCC